MRCIDADMEVAAVMGAGASVRACAVGDANAEGTAERLRNGVAKSGPREELSGTGDVPVVVTLAYC